MADLSGVRRALRWGARASRFKDDGSVVVPVRFSPYSLAMLLRGAAVDAEALYLTPRPDGSWDLGLRPGKGERLLDKPFVQGALLAAYDLLDACRTAEDVPDEVLELAANFEATIKENGLWQEAR